MSDNSKTIAVLTVQSTPEQDLLAVNDAGSVPTSRSYTTLLPILVNKQQYVLAYSQELESADVYEFTASDPWLKLSATKITIGKGKDILNVFTLGNETYLCTYTARDGVFTTYSICDDLSLSEPYIFYRMHELAISKGFSTVKFFTQFGQVIFLGYNITTGYVAMYSAAITAVSPSEGSLPLLMSPIWSHPWAPGWTRFAFFQFGGENFFLKTNIANPQHLNVNIDHVLDNPTSGTAEVGTHLNLVNALDLTNVEPFVLGSSEPYFATYISSTGLLVLYRFHGDCGGWTSVAKFDGPPGADAMATIRVSDSRIVLVVSC